MHVVFSTFKKIKESFFKIQTCPKGTFPHQRKFYLSFARCLPLKQLSQFFYSLCVNKLGQTHYLFDNTQYKFLSKKRKLLKMNEWSAKLRLSFKIHLRDDLLEKDRKKYANLAPHIMSWGLKSGRSLFCCSLWSNFR